MDSKQIKFICWLGKKYGGYSSDEEVIKEIEKRESTEERYSVYGNMIDEIFRKIAGVKEENLMVRGIFSCSNPKRIGKLKEVTNPLFQR